MKCKTHGQRILKSQIYLLNCNSCYSTIILYTYCLHINQKVISMWLIIASYFHNIKIYVGINVYIIPTLSFDMLNQTQYLPWNFITMVFPPPGTTNSPFTPKRSSWRKTASLDQRRSRKAMADAETLKVLEA